MDDKKLDILNNAGFVFQLGVEATIRRGVGVHRFDVRVRELPWRTESGEHGFIDLVAEHNGGVIRLVIECKRENPNSTWIGIVPTESASPKQRVRCHWCQIEKGSSGLQGWDDIPASPSTHEVIFCVQNSKGRDHLFLERTAAMLLPSAEAVAEEELRRYAVSSASASDWFVHVPVVVTNATLVVCTVDPSMISMIHGRAVQESATFTAVPYFRFRKPLVAHDERQDSAIDLRAAGEFRERTILVVNSNELDGFLRAFQFIPPSWNDTPWAAARERLRRQG